MKWIVPATLVLVLATPALAQDLSRSSSSLPSSSMDSPDLSRSSSTSSSAPSSSMDSPDHSRPSSSSSSSSALSSMDSPDHSRPSSVSSEPLPEEPAEPPVTPIASRDILQIFFDTCTDLASGDPEAYDRAAGAGWQAGDYEEGGPYKRIYSGFHPYDGYDQVALWSSVETYQTQRLGYCRVDFVDPTETINFADFAAIAGLKGEVTELEGYPFGAWETPDGQTLVIGDRRDGVVQIEFNLRTPKTAQ